jgi:hypothetical protein
MNRISLLCSAALLLAACGGPTAPAIDGAAAPEAISASPDAAPCPDDGPRFAVTGLCTGRISNYLDPAIGLISETPDGCQWNFTEMAFPGDEEVLIYRALTCKGVATALEFHGGAHSAALGYSASALYGEQALEIEPVRFFVSDPADPQKVIRDLFEGIPADERAKCGIQPLGVQGEPSDALVIQYNAADRAKQPTDEPISMCGEFGRDEDSAAYWRIFGGYAWFFSLGQDTPDFDPGSFMIFKKDAGGAWNLAS